jgi:putative addiction module component (TIGR02574 family)
MTKIAEQILSSAMALSEQERAEMAARLIDTLDLTEDADYVPAWEAEIRDRLKGLDTGVVEAIPWSEARATIRRGGADERQTG